MCGPRRSSPLGAQRLLVSVLLALSLATRSVVRCLQLTEDLQRFVTTLERYARTRNDIVFVLDESGSIGEDNFPAEVEFTQLTARLLTVSPDFSRVAVVTYGSNNMLHFNHISQGGSSMCGFLSEIEKIGYRGGSTRTKHALEYADTLLQGGRSGANSVAATPPFQKGVIIFAVGVANINRAELEQVATSPAHIYMLTNFPYIKEVNFDLRKDIHESQWDSVDLSKCRDQSGSCDVNAICGCGARGGNYRCICKEGYEGAGTSGTCRRCPRGSYKKEIGYENCKVCPAQSTTSDEGANSLAQCLCIPGYEGNPGSNVPCSPIKCAKLSDPLGGSTLPHPCGNVFDSKCDFKCSEGHCPYSCNMTEVLRGNFPWNSKSGVPRVCQANKEWSGRQFICDKVRCPALSAPPNGNMNCSSDTFEFGTTCVVGCSVGYNLVGNPSLTCATNGTWVGQLPTCQVVTCPHLKRNKRMQVNPSRCQNETMPYGSTCTFTCAKGWRLVDTKTKTAVDGIRKCLGNGKWQGANQKITCRDVEPPEIKNCPGDIEVNNAPHSPFSFPVTWNEPSAKDNSKNASVKLISPSYVTSTREFLIGEHVIQYVAVDGERQESKPCSFKVTVRDVEPPTLTGCPEDIVRYSAARRAKISWEEPTFTDNGGKVTVTLDRPPGNFSWGPPSVVNYTARDASGNTACCTFKVILKPYKCPYLRAPRNGYLTCDADEQHCSVSCADGYSFHKQPEPLYRCKQRANRNTAEWFTFKGKKAKLPWPDCSAPTRSPKVNITVGATYKTNSCQISEERMKALKEKFLEKLREKMGHILCVRNNTCSVENVSLNCTSRNPSSSTGGATNGQRLKRWFTKRQAQDGSEDGEFDLSFSFDLPLDTDFNATELIERCEDCKNSSLVPPSAVEETALTQVMKQALNEAFNETVAKTFPGATLVGTTHSIKSACGRGQVSNGLLCVNCPVGTYYYESSCVPCPIGMYSDKEAAESCVPCPGNKTTLEGWAGSESECLDLCAPGTWSTTGKEPCIACGPQYYQDEVGQLSCKQCAQGLSTGYWGAASSYECQGACQPGMYSLNGLAPCKPCPIGEYQPAANQTSCLKCDDGLGTRTTGTGEKSGCVAISYCNELQPCANGSTCVDEATGFSCVCPEGLRGPRCEENVDDCEPGICLNGGTCVDGVNTFSCLCPPGYTGSACETNVDDCASGPCFNGATCIDGIDKFACKCAKGFTGKQCEATFHDCATAPCRNNGSCFESITGFRCCCPRGFHGKTCELKEHACFPNPCLNNGSCTRRGDSFRCACVPGFQGRRCEREVDNCALAPCHNGGTCIDGLDSFTCQCHGLYTGPTCTEVLSSQFTLHFREASVLNYATVPVKRYLRALTISFHMKTTQTKERGTVFSYAFADPRTNKVQDNAFTISDPNKLLLYVYGESYDTKVVANDGQWHHCAVTWESSDGQWIFYWDRQEKARNHRAAGEVVLPGVLVVGQDQDDLGSAFSGIEAYSGHVAELNVWDYAMSPSEIREISQACRIAGNVVSWPELRLAATNGIVSDGDWELCKDTYSGQGKKQEISCHIASASIEERTSCSRRVGSCSTSPCKNGQSCVDRSDGSAECVCSASYEGRFCQYDVDECLIGRHNCSHVCVNVPGSYKCSCPEGMTLSDDGITCVDTSYCTDVLSAYLDGESWQRGCENCKCNKGAVQCSPLSCPALNCPAGEIMSKNPSQCCESCIREPPKCTLLPNNTLVSFDGLSFALNTKHDYVLFQDCYHGKFYGYLHYQGNEVAVRVYIHCLTATLFTSGRAMVGDRQVQLPHHEDTIMSLGTGSGSEAVQLRTHHGLVVTVRKDGAIVTSLPDGYTGKVCGLCGNANADVRDDFTTKHHLGAKDRSEFLASWSLPTPVQRGHDKAHLGCANTPRHVAAKVTEMCRFLKNDKRLEACFKSVENPRPLLKMCSQRMCSCYESPYCYCDVQAALKLACEKYNVSLSHLPGQACESRCPPGMEFNTCGPVVTPRCSPHNKIAHGPCVPGCFCPADRVLHKGRCIEKHECPADSMSRFKRT
ncbi:sushi, von Willebrand factor type A, EGF and pentraxin domain-containing protein 1 [Rhipicephalus sanguineus]|uniref:sushi, von Willebrand factor type A, EGF and pentraxin domain-containing protein 1 n=1 Tax=Rhipicephalus sanguineus TaxID=34632 RepID=UPI0020C21782|nr:sushi, von Willebrand factor type A, EGF and pentraxin domain-containing protein 1 [Rhipicephalus sanguineus]